MKIIKKDMYIRTKSGVIDKVLFDYNGHCTDSKCECKHICCDKDYYDEDTITKASFNIFDLIEKEDYVNGSKVIDVTSSVYIEVMSYYEHYQVYKNDEIKSIVTKEQFKQIEYKIKENE